MTLQSHSWANTQRKSCSKRKNASQLHCSIVYNSQNKKVTLSIERRQRRCGTYIQRDACSFAQSCLALSNPIDCSLPPSLHGIFQARILEWVSISFSRGSSCPRDQTWVSCIADRFFNTEPLGKPTQQGAAAAAAVQSLSCVQQFMTPWNAAHQASLSMGFPRQEYWSGLPFHSPGDCP